MIAAPARTIPSGERPVVAVIGGGLSGAAVAFHLARISDPREIEIIVIEPRSALGHGLAYSTVEPAHRINVPASKMTLISDDIAHFENWLAQKGAPALDADAVAATGDSFPQRRIFGQYVENQLRPYLESGAIRHVPAEVVDIGTAGAAFRLRLSSDESIDADCVVIATTHPPPRLPGALDALQWTKGFVPDPYDLDRIYAISSTDEVLIVGTGLTSADVIATLDRRGHRGRILAVSRHGYRSREHSEIKSETEADFAADPARTALALVKRIRAAIAADAARGVGWHAVIDRVRAQGFDIWRPLPEGQKRAVLRHLRAIWDVHRFRIAPQTAEVLRRRMHDGTLYYQAASLVTSAQRGRRMAVRYRPRHGRAIVTKMFDAVIVTTGPAHSDIMQSNPTIGSLGRLGLLTSDSVGLGLATGERSQAIGASGRASAGVFVAGPLARGTFGELMGVPEVTTHAERVANEVYRWVAAADMKAIVSLDVEQVAVVGAAAKSGEAQRRASPVAHSLRTGIAASLGPWLVPLLRSPYSSR